MEKLTSKDLMVGDYVGYRIDEVCCPSLQVQEVHSVDVKFGRCFYVTYERIEPIPITSKILEKIGFRKHKDCYKYLDETFYEFVKIDECENGSWWLNIMNGMVRKSIRYVHELQHALKLCEINMEIKL